MNYLVRDKFNDRRVNEGDEITNINGCAWTFEYVSGIDESGIPYIAVSLGNFCTKTRASKFNLIVAVVES